MTDRPMLFSGPMVRALLEGRKTQTRRVLKRLLGFGPITEFGPSDTPGYDWHFRDKRASWNDLRDAQLREYLPFKRGDRIWVKETHALYGAYPGPGGRVDYKADTPDLVNSWRPSIHMPRWASRLTLHVEEVRVQRLQRISEEDAEAEGAAPVLVPPDGGSCPHAEGFRDLWESINGAGSWDANPWVAALTFRVERANIEEAGE